MIRQRGSALEVRLDLPRVLPERALDLPVEVLVPFVDVRDVGVVSVRPASGKVCALLLLRLELRRHAIDLILRHVRAGDAVHVLVRVRVERRAHGSLVALVFVHVDRHVCGALFVRVVQVVLAEHLAALRRIRLFLVPALVQILRLLDRLRELAFFRVHAANLHDLLAPHLLALVRLLLLFSLEILGSLFPLLLVDSRALVSLARLVELQTQLEQPALRRIEGFVGGGGGVGRVLAGVAAGGIEGGRRANRRV
mmetsp:Transcript_11703/g.49086  ORF Transcript_11703/g.49086 Transcript_11703/m.49086 type:complete len:253 (-) Transcript_11703:454-1212(-)